MAKQDVTVELFYSGAWHDITFAEDVYTRDPIGITRGRADEASTTFPATASMTLDNRDGSNNPRNPTSPLYGIGRNLPARITVGSDVRFAGEVSSWTPQRAIKGDAWTQVQASGPLRRLGQGTPPAPSALRRWIAGTDPAAYWSLTEGVTSTSAQLTLGSGEPITRTDQAVNTGVMAPGEGVLGAWHEPSVRLNGNVVAGADVNISAATGRIVIDHVQRHGVAPDNTFQLTLYDADASTSFQMYWNSLTSLTDVGVKFRDAGALVTDLNTSQASAFDAAVHHYRLDIDQNGADIDWVLYFDGVSVLSNTETSVTLPDFAFVELAFTEAASTDEISLGHLAIWNAASPPALADAVDAAFGYPGEQAGVRFLRLCTEEGISGTAIQALTSQPMGPQFADTLPNLFREIEATDDGFIYDDRDTVGLEFHTGRSCYNQTAALDLNWQLFEVAPPTDPIVDDLNTRNDVTASRREGATAQAVRESGPLNVQDPTDDEEGVGRYTHQVNVNPFSDLVLPDYASWHLHRGTVDETRFPTVTVDLDATPGVDVSTVEIGDRLTITNMPAEITPDQVSLIILGWTETVGSHRRQITFTCAPESPFHVAEVEHSLYSIVGSSATWLRGGAITNIATSITFTIEEGPDWSFETAFDVVLNGERMTVTAIAAGSGTYPARTQAFTVIRSVNGVTKAHPNNSRLELFYPAHIGL